MSDWAVTTANSSLEFDTQNGYFNTCINIDDNHFINFFLGASNDAFAQVFEVDTATWAVTTAATSLEFDAAAYPGYEDGCQIDTNHFIAFWGNIDCYAQAFTVNTSTWAVTTANSTLTFETQSGGPQNSCCKINDNHFINFWRGPDSDAFAQVFEVDTSTWAVTTANSNLEFDTQGGLFHSCYQIDTNHFIDFYSRLDAKGFVQIFEINTSTWAVTTANSNLEFDTQSAYYNSCFKIDDNHFINFWKGFSNDGLVQAFTINTSTWAVTTAAASLNFDSNLGTYHSCYQIDDNHFINFFQGPDSDGFAQIFEVDTATWAVTTANTRLEFDTQNNLHNSCCQIDTSHFINFWSGLDADGYVQIFEVEVPTTGTNMQINITDAWKVVPAAKINIGDSWKPVVSIKQNIGDVWKDVF